MKLILHIVRKDLVRLRPWLVVWLLVLVLPIAIALGVSRHVKLAQAWTTSTDVVVGLLVLQAFVAYVIVLLLVQADAVFGTRQFWVTRPISGTQLLAAKLGGAFAVVWGGAIAVGLPWWLWCGLGGAEIARAGVDYALLAMIVIVLAMLLAAATDSLGRAILWSPVVLALSALSIPFLGMGDMPLRAEAVLTRLLVAAGLWLMMAMLMVAGLYFFRRRRWLIGGVPGALALLWLAGRVVPAERLEWADEPRELHPERGAAVQVAFDDAAVEPMRGRRQERVTMAHLRVSFVATGPVASELRLQGLGARQAWLWSEMRFDREGGLRVLGWLNPITGYTWPQADPETEAWLAAQQAKRAERARATPERPRSAGTRLQAYTVVPATIGARMTGEEANYRARLWLMLLRPEVRNEIPLQAGSSRRGQGHRMILQATTHASTGETFTVADFLPQSWTEELLAEAIRRSWFRAPDAPGYFVVNPRLKEFRTVNRLSKRRSVHVHGVAMGTWGGTVSADRVRRGGELVDRPGWIDKANLAYVGARTEAVFARDVTVDEFRALRPERR